MNLTLASPRGLHLKQTSVFIIYDLEFIGALNDFQHANIWEIAAIVFEKDYCREVQFSHLCHPIKKDEPFPSRHIHASYFNVTRKWLKDHHATSKKNALNRFVEFICLQADIKQKKNIILISHGNMKADKIVLENECKRCEVILPDRVYFFDTLPLFRSLYKKLGRYDLSYLQQYFKIETKLPDLHRALYDVGILHDLLRIVYTNDDIVENLKGTVVQAYTYPLQNIRGIGTVTVSRLIDKYHISSRLEFIHRLLTYNIHDLVSLQNVLLREFEITEEHCGEISNNLIDDVLKLQCL